MKYRFPENIKFPVTVITLCLVVLSGCKNKESDNIEINKVNNEKEEIKSTEQSKEYAVEAPPFSDGIYPCNDCHANFAPNPVRRNLVQWHDDISAMFNHDSENRWCLDCHDLKNRDYLRLASGDLLDFKESYKLCGQCHGEKYRDWKVGVHGKRTGDWNGKKEYLLCVNCHNPHSPKFKELIPDPPPMKQEDIK
jgi:Cytochrome c7 and related cytochrome c